jgi:hypothetical protein
VIQGENLSRGWLATRLTGGRSMKTLTRTQLWIPAIRARKVKDRLEQAKLVIAEVRERARVTAKRYAAHALTKRPMRSPTVRQRQRLAERLSAKSRS